MEMEMEVDMEVDMEVESEWRTVAAAANPFMIISQECRPLIKQVPGVQKKKLIQA